MPKSINGEMKLRTTLAVSAILSRARLALRRRSQGAAINNRCRRISISTGGHTEDGAEILGKRFNSTCSKLALRLLVNSRPGWQIVGHGAPRNAVTDDVAKAIK